MPIDNLPAGDAMTATHRPHFAGLDALRGLAALTVVVFHINWTNFTHDVPFVRNGFQMVDVFFVLSGFVIAYAYRAKLNTGESVGRFAWLRFWRLYPVHFAFLMVTLLIECARAFVHWRYGLTANHPAFVHANLYAFVLNLLLLQGLNTLHYANFNGPSWSISAEFYTYLIFAAAVFACRGRAAFISISIAGAIILLILAGMGRDFGFPLLNLRLLRCLAGFSLGVVVLFGYEKLCGFRFVSARPDLTAWLAIGAMVLFTIFVSVVSPGPARIGIYPITALLILLVALSSGIGPTRFLSSRPLQWLGAISYSLYMAHMSVIWGFAMLLRFGVPTGTASLRERLITPGALFGNLALVGAVGVTLLVAHLTYTYIEMPMRAWSRNTSLQVFFKQRLLGIN